MTRELLAIGGSWAGEIIEIDAFFKEKVRLTRRGRRSLVGGPLSPGAPLEIEEYRVERFRADTGTIEMLIVEGKTTFEAMRELLDGYRRANADK